MDAWCSRHGVEGLQYDRIIAVLQRIDEHYTSVFNEKQARKRETESKKIAQRAKKGGKNGR